MESAGRLPPVLGYSLVQEIRGKQREEPAAPVGAEDQVEDERERLRQRLERWEKAAFGEVRAKM